MTVEEFLAQKAQMTNEALEAYLASWTTVPGPLVDAVRYSLFAGGKRFRPALALGTAAIAGGDEAKVIPFACALEMIHTSSLIHDDLPAMDDDDLRRGKPTLHKVAGEAMAVLAGDALLVMAFDKAGEAGCMAAVRELAQAAGAPGMVGGQVLDLGAEGHTISLDELKCIHRSKTGALIRVSVRGAALIVGAGEAELAALTAYAEHLGLAFQIADDILDITGDEEVMGKPVGSDAANEKATYPAIVGLERARELADEAVAAAIAALEPFGPEADVFRALARLVVERNT